MDDSISGFRKMMKRVYKIVHEFQGRISHQELRDLCQAQFPSSICIWFFVYAFGWQYLIFFSVIYLCSHNTLNIYSFNWRPTTWSIYFTHGNYRDQQGVQTKKKISQRGWKYPTLFCRWNGARDCCRRQPISWIYATRGADFGQGKTAIVLSYVCCKCTRPNKDWNGHIGIIWLYIAAYNLLPKTGRTCSWAQTAYHVSHAHKTILEWNWFYTFHRLQLNHIDKT